MKIQPTNLQINISLVFKTRHG